MKYTFTLAGLLLAAAAGMAQKPVFRQPFAAAAGTKPDILTMPHHQNGRVAFMLKDAQKIELLLLNQSFAPVAKFSYPQQTGTVIYNTRAVPIGCLYAGNKIYNFIYDAEGQSSGTTSDGRDAVLLDKLDFDARTAELSLKYSPPPGEKLANAFTYNNTLYLLSASPNNDAITVCYIDSVLNRTVNTFDFNFAQLSGSMIRLEDALKTARVVQPGEADMDAYTAPVKIFPRNNGFYMAFDYKGKNILAVVDNYNRKLSLVEPAYNSSFTGDASQHVFTAVADNNIFAVAPSKVKLELGVFDLATGKLVKKYESAKADVSPAFAVTMPAAISVSKGKSNGEKPLDNTGALAKEMLGDNGGVRVVKNDAGQYVLTLAAFKSGAAAVPFPGVIYPASPPATATPFHSLNYGNKILIKTSFTAAYCKTVLAPGSFDKVKQSLKPTATEKLRDFFSLEENMPDAITLFTVNGALYYPWYDTEGQQFTIRTIK